MKKAGSLTNSVSTAIQGMLIAIEHTEKQRVVVRSVDWDIVEETASERKLGIALTYSPLSFVSSAGVATAIVRVESRKVSGNLALYFRKEWVPTHIRLACNGWFDLKFIDGFNSSGLVIDRAPEKTWSEKDSRGYIKCASHEDGAEESKQ